MPRQLKPHPSPSKSPAQAASKGSNRNTTPVEGNHGCSPCVRLLFIFWYPKRECFFGGKSGKRISWDGTTLYSVTFGSIIPIFSNFHWLKIQLFFGLEGGSKGDPHFFFSCDSMEGQKRKLGGPGEQHWRGWRGEGGGGVRNIHYGVEGRTWMDG